MKVVGRLLRLGLVMCGCGIVAAVLLPHPVAAWRQLDQLVDQSTADSEATNDFTLAVCSLTVWIAIVWLTTTLLMLAATQLPGRIGVTARAASCLVVPAIVRRLVCSALSISLAGGVLTGTAQAAELHHGAATNQTSTIGRQTTPRDLDWPQPGDAAEADQPDSPTGAGTITVQRGDSLWKLSAQSLGAKASEGAIAATWPTWWEHNRDVIGENPHLIRPGQQLHPPPVSSITRSPR